MSTSAEVTLWADNLPDGDQGRRVLVLPGSRYSVDLPGLQLPIRALALAGWQIWAASWDVREARDRTAVERMVVGAAVQFLARVGSAPQLVLAKSLGTMGAGWVADHGVPAVWTTPLLTDEQCAAEIARSAAPALLLAGAQDHTWDDAAARRTGKPARLIAGADHAWHTGDWREEIDVLSQLVAAVEEFADGLG
jgi:hypothetical protein